MTANCDAVVLSCIDFRFQEIERGWLDQNMKNKTYDFIEIAGATKDLDLAMKEISISVKLHSIKEVYLFHHEDCGAYGKMGTLEKQREDLSKAGTKIRKDYPFLKVFPYFIGLNGRFKQIPVGGNHE